MTAAAFIGINFQIWPAGGPPVTFIVPLISLTGPVMKYYRLRANVHRLTDRLAMAGKLVTIGWSALKFGIGV